ncbi:hypothetical protein GF1_04830 [Desulfolithobacter dissulfuricans]|uniref:Uncharacterized protein n=1 Tax=Desulfolithobacter dissulfuricans TaxID=2795293 RepID=A0A915U4Q2_9BACT|nr:hypothetical protein [Desulfolithobacter dissulfuricans]BCO08107.1 hypothetical protein GF1_04830 [Desulfolithobacter dissulfuricans]
MSTPHSQPLDLFFSGSVTDKLQRAQTLYGAYGSTLLAVPGIREGLADLDRLLDELRSQMAAMDMGSRCAHCGARPDGGCCSAYMAANTDTILLLINLLGGTQIHTFSGDETSCCFLGPGGCILPIKPMFCLNYNCSHIQESGSAVELAELERRAGSLLTRQTELEGELIRLLVTMGPN